MTRSENFNEKKAYLTSKRRYGMEGAGGLPSSSQSLRPHLQGVILLFFTKSEQTNLKLDPERLRTSPSFVQNFSSQVDTLSFWQDSS